MTDEFAIREWLVGLGFLRDADSQERFGTGVASVVRRLESLVKAPGGARGSVVAMAASLAGIARAVGKRVAAFAAQLEHAHFASGRGTAEVSDLTAVGVTAVREDGMPADYARSGIERFAHRAWGNPETEREDGALGMTALNTQDHRRAMADDVGKSKSMKDSIDTRNRRVELASSRLRRPGNHFDDAFVIRSGSVLERMAAAARHANGAIRATVDRMVDPGTKEETMRTTAAVTGIDARHAVMPADDTTKAEVPGASARRSIAPRASFAERLAKSALGQFIVRGEGDREAGMDAAASMRQSELMTTQRGGRFNLAGRYRFMCDKLSEAARGLGLSDRAGPRDRRIGEYWVTRTRSTIDDFLSTNSFNLPAVMLAASQAWPDMANLDFWSGHDNATNKHLAPIMAGELGNALFNSQSVYRPAPRWRYATRDCVTNHVEIHNDVKIQVSGSNHPDTTARAIGREQQTIADNLVRNMQGALQ